MEENCRKPSQVQSTQACDEVVRKTLNEDPFNVRAEKLAMDYCKHGFNVKKELFEVDLVVDSCGNLVPGTPDGGFRDTKDFFRLVQVVRVPLRPDLDAEEAADILYDTVLTKIVKSQAWMKHTGEIPDDFVIFCWLPPVGAYKACAEDLEKSDVLVWLEALMYNVRKGEWPFSLIVQVPEEPGGIFPARFGNALNWKRNRSSRKRKRNDPEAPQPAKNTYWDDLCFSRKAQHFNEDEDEEVMEWYLFDDDAEQEPEVVASPRACHLDAGVLRIIKSVILVLEHTDESTATRVSPSLFAADESFHAAEAPMTSGTIPGARYREPRIEAARSWMGSGDPVARPPCWDIPVLPLCETRRAAGMDTTTRTGSCSMRRFNEGMLMRREDAKPGADSGKCCGDGDGDRISRASQAAREGLPWWEWSRISKGLPNEGSQLRGPRLLRWGHYVRYLHRHRRALGLWTRIPLRVHTWLGGVGIACCHRFRISGLPSLGCAQARLRESPADAIDRHTQVSVSKGWRCVRPVGERRLPNACYGRRFVPPVGEQRLLRACSGQRRGCPTSTICQVRSRTCGLAS